MTELLEVSQLRVDYHGIAAVRGIDLQVRAGEVLALLGANGAGKTSTLRAISGLVPAAGSVRLDGRELAGMSPENIAALGVAHVPAGRGLFASLSVADNLRMGLYAAGHEETATGGAQLNRMLETFPMLRERWRQPAGTLSGGQAQQLAIARALVASPRVLLLDEMSMGLAPQVVAELFRVVAELKRSLVAVVLVEQFVGEALAVADQVVVLEQGMVALAGSPQDVAGDRLARAYLGEHAQLPEPAEPAVPTSPVSPGQHADRDREELRIGVQGRQARELERLAARRGSSVDELVSGAVGQLLDNEQGSG